MRKNKRTHFMAGIWMIVFVCAFLVITGRFLYIQAFGEVDEVSLKTLAEEKRTTSHKLDAERGKIFDNNGETLAYDRPSYRLYAVVDTEDGEKTKKVNDVENAKKTAEQLAPLLKADKKELQNQLERGLKDKKIKQIEFGPVGKGLSQKTKDKIEALKLPGIHFMKDTIRYYPNGTFASHIIGFAKPMTKKTDDGQSINIVGQTGIEEEMNELLSGEDGHISYQRDLYNKKLLNPEEVVTKPKNGANIYLTIDQKIQTLLEDVLTQADEKYQPERMTAIVMDPKTGKILAMSNRPSYNPNNPTNVENWYNDSISIPFEPGSTMKMFTWAAAINEGVYNGSEGFMSGRYQINERISPVSDHNGGKGWGTISYDEGFQRSSNVAAAKLVWEKLGPDKFLDYLEEFEFDKETGIDLPGEVPGKILYNWPLEKLTTAFGQGSTLTPIQQMKAATAIANDGKMMKPYVVEKIVDPNTGEIIKQHEPQVVGEPITEETSEQVLKLLESVVTSKKGTGRPYQLDNYTAGGKTGTAQIPNPDGPGYMIGYENYIFSFLGMAPIEDPKLMIYLSIKQPNLQTEEGYESGSAPLAFIFKNVMENSLHYLNIEPDQMKNEQISKHEVPQLVGKSTSEAKRIVEKSKFNVTIVGNGDKIIATNMDGGKDILGGDRLIVVTNKPTMPNIVGWSQRDVFQLSSLLELKVETKGNGYVIKQNIKEGKSIKKADLLKVELKPPLQKSSKK